MVHDFPFDDLFIVRSIGSSDACLTAFENAGLSLMPMHEDAAGTRNGQFITDIRYDSKLASSFRHSNTRQPLHTDGAYSNFEETVDFVFFYCQQAAASGGESNFVRSNDLILHLSLNDPLLLCRCLTIDVSFFKGEHGKTRRIIGSDNSLCWNYYRSKCELDQNLPQDFFNYLERHEAELVEKILLEPGDAVFFPDNYVLHGRNSFIGERCLLKGGAKKCCEKK